MKTLEEIAEELQECRKEQEDIIKFSTGENPYRWYLEHRIDTLEWILQ